MKIIFFIFPETDKAKSMLFSEAVVHVLIYSHEVSTLNFDVVFSHLK